MTKKTEGDKRIQIQAKIDKKCRYCHFGTVGHKTTCGHPLHPGIVGGYGSEWVLYCGNYMKTNTHGGPGRGQGRKPIKQGEDTVTVSLRMTPTQRAKLAQLGGAEWVRSQIDAQPVRMKK